MRPELELVELDIVVIGLEYSKSSCLGLTNLIETSFTIVGTCKGSIAFALTHPTCTLEQELSCVWRPQESVTLKELIKPVGTVNCVCNFRIHLFLLRHCNQTEAPYTQDVAMGWRGLRVVTCKRSWGHSLCLHSYDIYIHNTLDFSRRARKMWLEGCKAL